MIQGGQGYGNCYGSYINTSDTEDSLIKNNKHQRSFSEEIRISKNDECLNSVKITYWIDHGIFVPLSRMLAP